MPLLSVAECCACADTEARTPIGASENFESCFHEIYSQLINQQTNWKIVFFSKLQSKVLHFPLKIRDEIGNICIYLYLAAFKI